MHCTGCVAVPKHLLKALLCTRVSEEREFSGATKSCRKAVGWSLGRAASWRDVVNKRCCPAEPDRSGSDLTLGTGTPPLCSISVVKVSWDLELRLEIKVPVLTLESGFGGLGLSSNFPLTLQVS